MFPSQNMSDLNEDLWPAVPAFQASGRWPGLRINVPGCVAPGRLCLAACRWSRGHQGTPNSVVQSSLKSAADQAHAADLHMWACVFLHPAPPEDLQSYRLRYLKEGKPQSHHLRDDSSRHNRHVEGLIVFNFGTSICKQVFTFFEKVFQEAAPGWIAGCVKRLSMGSKQSRYCLQKLF